MSHCKIAPNQLSAAGKASVQDSDHELIAICNMCLDRLEGPSPLVEPYDDEQIATTVVKTSTKKPAVDWTVVIPTIGWKSLRVSASESNPVQKGNQQRGNIELTRLEGVAVAEGHVEATKGISLDTLRKIGVKLGLGPRPALGVSVGLSMAVIAAALLAFVLIR